MARTAAQRRGSSTKSAEASEALGRTLGFKVGVWSLGFRGFGVRVWGLGFGV